MTRHLLAIAAASTLTLSSALAQSGATSGGGTSGLASERATGAQSQGSMSPAAPGISTTIAAQTPDQWLASKFKGTEVVGSDDVKIGAVEDILFDRAGTVKAVLVGVGGFLGIGAKQIAFSLPAFQIVPGKDGAADQLRLSMTKDQLASAPEFKPYEPARTAAGSGQPRPSTSGQAPAPPARAQ